MRLLTIVAVALLALTAGCNAFGAGQETPTLTPAEVPTDTTSSAADGATVAPGITADGVVDVGLLAERHVRAIANESYVWNETQREYRGADGDGVAVEARTSVVTNGTVIHRRTDYVGASPSRSGRYAYRLEEFGTEDVAYTVWLSSREGEPGYSRADDPAFAPQHHPSVAESIRTYLALDAAAVTRVDVGERPHYRVSGTMDEHPSYGPVEDYRVRAIVRGDGFVQRLSANFTVTVDGRRIPVEYRFAYSEVGTAEVTPPDWLEEARERHGDEPRRSDWPEANDDA